MDVPISYHTIFLIGAGIILQSITLALSTEKPESIKITLVWLFVSLVAFIPYKEDHNYSLRMHCIYYLITYMFIFAGYFSDKILPVINENSLLLFNIIFLANLINFGLPAPLDLADLPDITKMIIWILLIPSTVVLVNAFLPYPTPKWMKMIFYVWYLCMATCILFTSIFYYSHDTTIFTQNSLFALTTLVTLGMIGLSLFIDLFNIFALLPFKSKYETFAEARARVAIQIDMLSSKYADEQVSFLSTLLIVILVPGTLILNHHFSKMNDQLAINIALLASRFIFGSHVIKQTPQPGDQAGSRSL